MMFLSHSCLTSIPVEAGSIILHPAPLSLSGGWTHSGIVLVPVVGPVSKGASHVGLMACDLPGPLPVVGGEM